MHAGCVDGVLPTPFVVAHRGSSHLLAEHTLAAYLRAIDEGADGLECDVRLTRDGHLVCVHDRRIDRTSNGSGIVSEFDLADLGSFDFASWKAEPEIAEPGTVLTLQRLLEAVVAAGRPIRLLVETKHPTRYAGLVEQQLVRLLRRFGLAEGADPEATTVTVMSFSPLALRRVRLLAPGISTVLLLDRVHRWRRDGTLPPGVGVAGPGVHLVRSRPDYVRRLRAAGYRLYVWTVNTADDLDLALAAGAEGIITDRPADVLRRLGRSMRA